MLDLAKQIINAGYTAIVDATFLKRAQRDPFRRWAMQRAIPFVVLDFTADIATLKTRLQARHETNRDASEADIEVLQHQLATQEPLQPDELAFVMPDAAYQRPERHMSMPKKSGIELIKQIKSERPKLRFLVLSMHEEQQYAVRAIKSGASGYLTKESAPAQLLSAIRKVAAGSAFISAAVAEQLALGAMPQTDGPPHTALSDREYEVFQLLVVGKTVSDIASRLNLSGKTVSTHKVRLMEKMDMTNHTELIRYALAHRLVDGADSAE